MPRVYQAVDHVEAVTDTMVEDFGNESYYHWNNGCDLSYSATDLTVTISAGNVTHNALDVPVAEDTITLVPDATHPLWAHIGIDSTGNAVVVHGTAAADPVEPELGDYVRLALVKVEANQANANACEHKIDKRVKGKQYVTIVSGTGATTTSLVSDVEATATLAVVSGLTVALSANSTYLLEAQVIISATSAGSYYLSFNAPTGATFRIYSADGDSFNQDNAYALETFAAGEERNFQAWASILTTTAGNFTVSHMGNGRVMKAKSRLELI